MNRTTFTESLDPRTKLLGLVILGIQIVLLKSLWTLLATSVVTIVGVIASPITPLMLFRQIRRAFWFVVFILLINIFTVSGNVLFRIWGMYGTLEGMTEGLVLSGRILLLLILSYVFVRTTSVAELLDGIEAMLSPFRKRFSSFIILLSLTFSFVPLLIQSAQRIKAAQVARGSDVDSSFFRQVQFASGAALPLFVSAFRASQHLAEAMDARCYDTTTQRTPFGTPTMSPRDWTTLFFLVVFFIVLTYLW